MKWNVSERRKKNLLTNYLIMLFWVMRFVKWDGELRWTVSSGIVLYVCWIMRKVFKANYLAFDKKIIGLLKYFLRLVLTHEQRLIQSLPTQKNHHQTLELNFSQKPGAVFSAYINYIFICGLWRPLGSSTVLVLLIHWIWELFCWSLSFK